MVEFVRKKSLPRSGLTSSERLEFEWVSSVRRSVSRVVTAFDHDDRPKRPPHRLRKQASGGFSYLLYSFLLIDIEQCLERTRIMRE
jgi:hypothetical protein